MVFSVEMNIMQEDHSPCIINLDDYMKVLALIGLVVFQVIRKKRYGIMIVLDYNIRRSLELEL